MYFISNKFNYCSLMDFLKNVIYKKYSFQYTFGKKMFCATEKTTPIKYKFNIGVVKIPHFSKKEKGGEDAFESHEGMICVADGVGGWNDVGVDPSKYSKELCKNIKSVYLKNANKYFSQPIKMFIEAAELTRATGSATFCMCVLDLEKNYMHTVNLGDSGYMLLRSTEKLINNPNPVLQSLKAGDKVSPLGMVFKSQEQQRSFNFPLQVGTHGDSPQEAKTNVHEIQENDIIVLGTDGLWDNLFEDHIIQIIKPFFEISNRIQSLSTVAEMIGETAERYSLDQRYKSPFSVKSNGLYLGGKPDDITIIVAQVVKNEMSSKF